MTDHPEKHNSGWMPVLDTQIMSNDKTSEMLEDKGKKTVAEEATRNKKIAEKQKVHRDKQKMLIKQSSAVFWRISECKQFSR